MEKSSCMLLKLTSAFLHFVLPAIAGMTGVYHHDQLFFLLLRRDLVNFFTQAGLDEHPSHLSLLSS
jgi:hypothetical protein